MLHNVALLSHASVVEPFERLRLVYALHNLNADIAFLFDCRTNGELEYRQWELASDQKHFIYFDRQNEHGMGIAINTNFLIHTTELHLKTPGIMEMTMDTQNGGVLHVIAADTLKGNDMEEQIDEILKSIPTEHQLLLCCSSPPKNQSLKETQSFMGDGITSRSLGKLECTRTMFMTKDSDDHTKAKEGDRTEELSYVSVSQAQFELDLINEPQPVHHFRDLSQLKDDEIREAYQKMCLELLEPWTPEYSEAGWDVFQGIIEKATTVTKVHRGIRISHEQVHDFFTSENPSEVRLTLENLLREQKREVTVDQLTKLCNTARYFADPDQEVDKFLRQMSGDGGRSGQTLIQVDEGRFLIGKACRDKWRAVFSNNLMRRDVVDHPGSQLTPREESAPSDDEIQAAIAMMKGEKRSLHSLTKESFDALPPSGKEILNGFIRHAWVHGIFTSWKRSMMYPIPKNTADVRTENDFRGITDVHPCSTIIQSIINQRIKPTLRRSLGKESMRTAERTIFAVHRAIEVAAQAGVPLYMAYIDVEKAYDNVERTKLLNLLETSALAPQQNSGNKEMIDVIRDLYTIDTKAYVNTVNGVSEDFCTNTGIPQGGMLSPLLFQTLVDDVMKRSEISETKRNGIPMNNWNLTYVFYGDEIVIFSTKLESLQKHVDAVTAKLEGYGLHLNKSKCHFVSKENPTTAILKVAGSEVQAKNQVSFLGALIYASLLVKGDVERRRERIDKCAQQLRMTSDELFLDPLMTLRLYETIPKSYLMFATESWTVADKMLGHLNAIQIGALKTLFGDREDILDYVAGLRTSEEGIRSWQRPPKKVVIQERYWLLKKILLDSDLCLELLYATLRDSKCRAKLWILQLKDSLREYLADDKEFRTVFKLRGSAWLHLLDERKTDGEFWRSLEDKITGRNE